MLSLKWYWYVVAGVGSLALTAAAFFVGHLWYPHALVTTVALWIAAITALASVPIGAPLGQYVPKWYIYVGLALAQLLVCTGAFFLGYHIADREAHRPLPEPAPQPCPPCPPRPKHKDCCCDPAKLAQLADRIGALEAKMSRIEVLQKKGNCWWVVRIDEDSGNFPQDRPIELGQPPQKNQLVYVGTATCAYCVKMKATTLRNPKVLEKIQADYTYIDASGRDGIKRYNVQRVPTYLILAPDGTEIKRGVGYRSAEEFLAWLNASKATEPAQMLPESSEIESVNAGGTPNPHPHPPRPLPTPHPTPRPGAPVHAGYLRDGPAHNLGRSFYGHECRHWCYDIDFVFEIRGWCAHFGCWLYWHPREHCWYRWYVAERIYVPYDDLTDFDCALITLESNK